MTFLTRQRGLSLIELMIAILLSSLLLLGVLQIFDANRNTLRMSTAFARVQESGRFATDLLLREIRMADYWGCLPPEGNIKNHLDTTDSDYTANADIYDSFSLGTNGVLGENNVVDGKTVGTMEVITGTDILTLSGADNACGGTSRMVPSTTAASVDVSQNCSVEEGDVILISDCQTGELMTITDVQDGNGGSSDKRTLVHNTGLDSADWVKNASKELQKNDYGRDTKVLLPYRRSFFIAESPAGTNSLYMSVNGDAAQEMVPGIDDIQVLYGRDSNNNDVVDIWQAAVADRNIMAEVLAIKVQLVVASDGTAGTEDQEVIDLDGKKTTYDDARLRKVYLSTAKVRNRGSM